MWTGQLFCEVFNWVLKRLINQDRSSGTFRPRWDRLTQLVFNLFTIRIVELRIWIPLLPFPIYVFLLLCNLYFRIDLHRQGRVS